MTTVTPSIGQMVWLHMDSSQFKGMRRRDDDAPFMAFVAFAESDRLISVLAVDHRGLPFPLQSVPLFQGDDLDDHKALYHCELKAPEARKSLEASGIAGKPTALGLGDEIKYLGKPGDAGASLALTFTVPPGETYTFISAKAGVDQAFTADEKPQVLTLNSAQIAAGALGDLSLTTVNAGVVSLAIAAIQQDVNSAPIRTYRFTETVTVAEAPVVASPSPAKPVAPAATSSHADSVNLPGATPFTSGAPVV